MPEALCETFLSVAGQALDKRVWLPDGEPVGVVQLVHGMAEHIDRYNDTARALNDAGFAVVGHTHLGHGANAPTLGYFGARGGWDALIADTHALRKETQARFPGRAYFLLGHSMGSFVVRGYCLQYERGLNGVILSGTGHFAPATVGAGLFLSRAQCVLGMAKKPGRLLARIANAGYLNGIEHPRTAFDWLTTDEAIVKDYVEDRFCGFPFTVRGYYDLFSGLKRLYPKNLSVLDKDIPVLLFSGARDPVGQMGAGVRETQRELRAAGVRDVACTLYENGRHEMFNEARREDVWRDLIAWLRAHGAAQSGRDAL